MSGKGIGFRLCRGFLVRVVLRLEFREEGVEFGNEVGIRDTVLGARRFF